ncbi:hypothetical protein Tco_0427117, partial [Tanacetum coccineum]
NGCFDFVKVASSCLRMSEGSRVSKSKVNESNIMRDVLASMRNYGKRVDLSTMLSFGENTLPKHMFRTQQDDDTGLLRDLVWSESDSSLNTGITILTLSLL